jgi:hypothetical protein
MRIMHCNWSPAVTYTHTATFVSAESTAQVLELTVGPNCAPNISVFWEVTPVVRGMQINVSEEQVLAE